MSYQSNQRFRAIGQAIIASGEYSTYCFSHGFVYGGCNQCSISQFPDLSKHVFGGLHKKEMETLVRR